jgi:hypothetical protein
LPLLPPKYPTFAPKIPAKRQVHLAKEEVHFDHTTGWPRRNGTSIRLFATGVVGMVGMIRKRRQPANFKQGCNKVNEENPMQRFISRIAMVVVVYAWVGMCSLGGWPPAFVYAAPLLCQETQEAAPQFLER